jgi:riboflavin synthase
MFTGIITDTSEVLETKTTNEGLVITCKRPPTWTDLKLGESIAINGVCVTISKLEKQSFSCNLMPETLAVSSFGQAIPKIVNLERALKVGDRLSGHIVQGHVDGVNKVTSVQKSGEFHIYLTLEPELRKFVVYKGSITIDGVSLTVTSVTDHEFSVAIIPFTAEHTTLGELSKGDVVNIEVDIIGKYVANMMKEQ